VPRTREAVAAMQGIGEEIAFHELEKLFQETGSEMPFSSLANMKDDPFYKIVSDIDPSGESLKSMVLRSLLNSDASDLLSSTDQDDRQKGFVISHAQYDNTKKLLSSLKAFEDLMTPVMEYGDGLPDVINALRTDTQPLRDEFYNVRPDATDVIYSR
jgi:hypothetical protein